MQLQAQGALSRPEASRPSERSLHPLLLQPCPARGLVGLDGSASFLQAVPRGRARPGH